jgi:hypothetical protein
MVVCCESVLHTVLGHEEETDGIAQGPTFIGTPLKVHYGCSVHCFGYVDHLNGYVVLEVRNESKGGLPWKPAGVSESNEFRQDVIVRQPDRRGLEILHGLGMAQFRAVVKTQESRSVQQHQRPTSWEEPYSRAKSASMLSLSAPVGLPRSTAPA